MPAMGEDDVVKTGTLEIEFTGLRSDEGTVRVGLFNSAATFSKKGKEFRKASVKAKGQKATVRFEDVPYGDYGVSFYHDENDNNEYDLGKILWGKEKYGFSNDAKPGFKAPPYEKVKFELDEALLKITIKAQ